MACERIFIKTDSTESRYVIGPVTILFLRRVRGSFSPDILQAGAVKGLKDQNIKYFFKIVIKKKEGGKALRQVVIVCYPGTSSGCRRGLCKVCAEPAVSA